MILIRPSRCWLLALLSSVLCCAAVADNPTPPPSTEKSGLTGHRFLTLNTVVRVRQIEVTRDIAHGPDESSVHTPAEVRTFRETIDKAWPGSRITWAFSWLGLHDTRYGGRNGMDGLHLWLTEIRNRWPDAKLITQGEFGELWRTHFKNNEKLDYRFLHRDCGIRASQEDLEIRWFMNPDFRLSLLGNWKENSTPNVIDFTRYDLPAKEPDDPELGKHSRNWSLMNRINQKGTRPQDQPVPLTELTSEEQSLIRRHYPELFASGGNAK